MQTFALFLVMHPPSGCIETPPKEAQNRLRALLNNSRLVIHSWPLRHYMSDTLEMFEYVDRFQRHVLGDRCITHYVEHDVPDNSQMGYVVPQRDGFAIFFW